MRALKAKLVHTVLSIFLLSLCLGCDSNQPAQDPTFTGFAQREQESCDPRFGDECLGGTGGVCVTLTVRVDVDAGYALGWLNLGEEPMTISADRFTHAVAGDNGNANLEFGPICVPCASISNNEALVTVTVGPGPGGPDDWPTRTYSVPITQSVHDAACP